MPAEHDGRSLFRFELRFSEDFGRLSYQLLRDTAFRVTNGVVRQARRVEPGQNRRWTIAVRPHSYGDVTVELPATTDCAATGAICTEDGRPLSNSLAATVTGAPPELAFLDGADRERRVEPKRAAGFPIGKPVGATGVEPLQWRVDDRKGLIGIDADAGQLLMAVEGASVFELLDNGWFRYWGSPSTRYRFIVFYVTVTVTDSLDRDIETQIPIRVGMDEAGEVALSTYEPRAGAAISASVSDPDEVRVGSASWHWEFDDGSLAWPERNWQRVKGATASTLTPPADMAGSALRAVASYADGLSAPGERDRRAESAATDEVELPNAAAHGVELMQGPLTARFARDGTVVQAVALVAGRQTAVAMELRHDRGGLPPAVVLRVETGPETLHVEAEFHATTAVADQPEGGAGRESFQSVYVANVPGRFVGPEATFSVLVDPDGALNEEDETDNEIAAPLAELRLVEAPAFRVSVVPLSSYGGGPPTSIDPEPLLATTLALLPIGAHEVQVAAALQVDGGASPREMLDTLHAAWNRDADPDEFYHGLYQESEHRLEGLALVGGRVSVSPVPEHASNDDASRIVAHGIAHNFGLEETPAPPATAYGWSSASQRFFSAVDQEIMAPMEGTTLFISRENYERAMRWMDGSMNKAEPPPAGEPAGGIRSIALTGGVDASGAWYLYRADHSPKPPREVSAGPYTAVLYNRGGIPLLRQPLPMLPLSEGSGGAWALRVPYTPHPLTLRIWSEDGGLLLDVDLDL